MAQNTAMHSVFEHPFKKYGYLRGFHQDSRRKTAIREVFSVSRKAVKPIVNVQKHCKNQCFRPTKTAKTIPQRAPKSQKLPPRFPDRHIEKNYFASSNPHHGIQFILSDILPGKSSGILFGILFEILSGHSIRHSIWNIF